MCGFFGGFHLDPSFYFMVSMLSQDYLFLKLDALTLPFEMEGYSQKVCNNIFFRRTLNSIELEGKHLQSLAIKQASASKGACLNPSHKQKKDKKSLKSTALAILGLTYASFQYKVSCFRYVYFYYIFHSIPYTYSDGWLSAFFPNSTSFIA